MVEHRKLYTAARWSALAVLALLCAALEEQLCGNIRIGGIAPILGGSLVSAVAVYTNPFAGAMYGLFAGLLRFTNGSSAAYTAAFAYMLGGAAAGLVVRGFMRRRLATVLMCSLIINALNTLLFFIFVVWIPKRAGASALLYVAAPEILYSTLCALPLYPIVRAICKRTEPPPV